MFPVIEEEKPPEKKEKITTATTIRTTPDIIEKIKRGTQHKQQNGLPGPLI